MPSDIGVKFETSGEATFRSAIQSLDAQIKAFGTGIDAATAQMEKMGAGEEAAQKKSELLGQQIDAQKQKLTILQQQYESAQSKLQQLAEALEKAKESGDPQAIDKATIAYNKQEVQVARLSTEMSKTEQGIANATGKMEESGDAAESTAEKVDKLSDSLSLKLAGDALGSVVDGMEKFAQSCINVGKGIWDMVSQSSVMADDMLTLSTQTGISTQALQEWGYASRFVDTEVSTITGSLTKMTKNMTSTSKDTVAAFDTLKVSVQDSNGHLRDAQTVYWECIDALGKVSNETERDSLAMQIFGKSAKELNPLIEAGSDEWQHYCEEAHAAGLVLSDEGMSALGAFNDGLQRVDATMDAAKNQIMAALAPAFENIANKVADAAQVFTQWIQTDEAQEFLGQLAETVTEVADGFLENLIPAVQGAIDTVGKIADGVKFASEHIDGIVAAIASFVAILGTLKIALAAIQIAAIFTNPAAGAIAAVVAIVAAVAALAVAVATHMDQVKEWFSNAWQKVETVWGKCGDFFKGIWTGITDAFHDVVDWIGDKFKKAWEAVKGVWDKVIGFFKDIWKGITDAFHDVVEWIGGIFGKAWDAVTGVWDKVTGYFEEVVEWIFDAFKNAPGRMLEMGKNLIEGIWDGIKSMGSWIWEKITGFVEEHIAGPIKDFFGIHSPSTYMRDNIGVMLMRGVADGINKGSSYVEDAYTRMIPDIGQLLSGTDPYTIRSNVSARSDGKIGGNTVLLDNRPIILKLNGREVGRTVRGYA